MLRSKDTWGERNEKYDEYYFWKFNHTHKKTLQKKPSSCQVIQSHIEMLTPFFPFIGNVPEMTVSILKRNKADCYIRVKKLTLDFIET